MSTALVLKPQATRTVWLRGLGVRFLVGGEQTGGRVALVEHPSERGSLASPMHTHEREDESSSASAETTRGLS